MIRERFTKCDQCIMIGAGWQAKIQVNGRKLNVGNFDSPEDAAKAYDVAAKLHHGEFAMLNFP